MGNTSLVKKKSVSSSTIYKTLESPHPQFICLPNLFESQCVGPSEKHQQWPHLQELFQSQASCPRCTVIHIVLDPEVDDHQYDRKVAL
jgi:hypothetical protein